MGLQLIKEDSFFKQVITTTGGQYVDGVWIKGTETKAYEEKLGLVDPYLKSESSLILPNGLSNEDARLLYTDEVLVTHQSLKQGSNLADIVYLYSSPDVDATSIPYTVYDKMEWSKNQGFTLIDNFHGEYLIVRQNRID